MPPDSMRQRQSTQPSPKLLPRVILGLLRQPPPYICTAVLPTSRPPTHLTRRSTMVKEHHVRVYKSEENLPREDQLAHKIALVRSPWSPRTPSRLRQKSRSWCGASLRDMRSR